LAVPPYLEQDALPKEFRLDEAWDSPHNKKLLARGRRPPSGAQPRGGQQTMNQPSLTDEIFTAFLKCRYQAYFKLRGACGERSAYELLQQRLSAEHRAVARQELLRRHPGRSSSTALRPWRTPSRRGRPSSST
jgi:hypothetical protein